MAGTGQPVRGLYGFHDHKRTRLETRRMAIYRIDSAQLEPPPDADPTPADWMDGCPHAAACRMQLERLEGPFECDGLGWMDDLARLLGCGEDCECAE